MKVHMAFSGDFIPSLTWQLWSLVLINLAIRNTPAAKMFKHSQHYIYYEFSGLLFPVWSVRWPAADEEIQ